VAIASDGGCERVEVPQRLPEQPCVHAVRDAGTLDDAIAWHRADIRQRDGARKAVASRQPDFQGLARVERRNERHNRGRRKVHMAQAFVRAKQRSLSIDRDAFEMRRHVSQDRWRQRRKEPVSGGMNIRCTIPDDPQ
jgi:hypothetical protein